MEGSEGLSECLMRVCAEHPFSKKEPVVASVLFFFLVCRVTEETEKQLTPSVADVLKNTHHFTICVFPLAVNRSRKKVGKVVLKISTFECPAEQFEQKI